MSRSVTNVANNTFSRPHNIGSKLNKPFMEKSSQLTVAFLK